MVQGTQLKLFWLPCNTFTNILIVSAIMNYRRRSEKEALIQLMIPVDSLPGWRNDETSGLGPCRQ